MDCRTIESALPVDRDSQILTRSVPERIVTFFGIPPWLPLSLVSRLLLGGERDGAAEVFLVMAHCRIRDIKIEYQLVAS